MTDRFNYCKENLVDKFSKKQTSRHTRKCKTDASQGTTKVIQERTVEEIADRYYQVAFAIAKARGLPMEKHSFDMEKEQERKYNVFKVLMRTREQVEQERNLIAELRRWDQVIRKLQKEVKTLEKQCETAESKVAS